MRKGNLFKRLLCLMLVVSMLAAYAVPASAADTSKIDFEQVDNDSVTADFPGRETVDEVENEDAYADTDVVRVSIILDTASTIEAGYSTMGIAQNAAAMNYRAGLQKEQDTMVAKIEKTTKEDLDVVWNLTLAANIISANVPFGQIETIEKIAGVKSVVIETQYEPDVVSTGAADPNMATSSAQIGSSAAWAAGYTGAGSRIAIIDTGTDNAHQSFSAEGFEYSLAYQAGKSGKTVEEYKAGLDLLDADKIAAVADQLNVSIDPEQAYINSKIPFGYNYVDGNYNTTHTGDSQGEHGSHVSGIAAANAFIPNGDGTFSNALDSVMAQGVAPDAQILTMKVFGASGGAYDSDYMVAIEDAVILGADSVNLSLGSGNPGMSRNSTAAYQEILDNLVNSGTVVSMSAGNSGSWVENAYNAGYLYADDVSMQTNGSPGSYTNALTVASVDNDGTTGNYVSVGDSVIFYAETFGYGNVPFTTVAGEQEFIFLDSIGTDDEWAAVADVLEGKIALCARGTTSFYQKANAAVANGAIATIIYNNQPGVINMNMAGYSYTAPCVSITQADGAVIKAAATPVTDDTGKVLYYTGKMTVGKSVASGQYNSDYYTMSSFSSWGVPGSLELKPEITAPGGSIYSVYGATPDGGGSDQYEVMSGTSMASPQVAGMAAVAAQYIRESGLEEKTGLDARTLINSLLMSTAEPMVDGDGNYYSVLQQGSGLANVGKTITADSYVLMGADATKSYADGKVKVELGDDPDRDGNYTFSFSINNLTNEEKVYTLDGEFFIQAPTSDGTDLYMYTSTALIDAEVSFTVDGETVNGGDNMDGLDFNDDGVVNAADGQALLDLATGAIDALAANTDKADLDGDGDIDSYDAYLFFCMVNDAAVVPANGSVDVTVNVTIPEDWKETIDYYYPNGTYIEGYVFADGVASEEGVSGTAHSIPVLGFFGNWTEASMYDVGSYQEYVTGEETRAPYLGNAAANTYTVVYADDSKNTYAFGGNPLVPDDTYMPERNAINSNDTVSSVQFTLIRNAAASRFTAVNTTTGETLVNRDTGAAYSAYYYVNGGYWTNTAYSLKPKAVLSGASEGDVINMTLTMVPEYYVDAEGNVDWDALGEGADFATTMVIDNTAPELKELSVNMIGNTMTVTASDNQYVAAVALYNKSGAKLYTYTGAKQDIAPGEEAEYVLDLTGVNGKNFLLQVCDYAMNTTTYLVEMQLGEEEPLPDLIMFNEGRTGTEKDCWVTSDDPVNAYAPGYTAFRAATIVDHMVLAAAADGGLYVMPEDDLTDVTYIGNTGVSIDDMAYNKADGKVYGVASGYLITIDKLTAEVEVVDEIGVLTKCLACDENGTFYCYREDYGYIYSFTLDTIKKPVYIDKALRIMCYYGSGMEINPNNGHLYFTTWYERASGLGMMCVAYLYEYDLEAKAYVSDKSVSWELSCLLCPEKQEGGSSWTDPTNEVSGIQLSAVTLNLIKGSQKTLTATVQPWTATDRTVTWTSADEAVATVDSKGVVTAVGAGTTTITATSNLDPSVSASCTVNVESLTITLEGTLQDESGNSMFYTWNMENEDTWTGGVAIDTSMTSATYNPSENVYYIEDADAYAMHKVDPTTGKSVAVGPTTINVPLWDIAYSDYFSEVNNKDLINGVYSSYLFAAEDPMNLSGMAFNLSSLVTSLTGITSLGYEAFEHNGAVLDAEHLVMLDNLGRVLNFWMYETESGMSGSYNIIPSDLPCTFPGDDSGYHMYTSLAVGEDGYLYVSTYTNDTNELYRLVYDEASESYISTRIGDVGEGVWPATITAVTSNEASDGAEFVAPKATAKMDAAVVTAEELAAITSGEYVSMETDIIDDAEEAETAAVAAEPAFSMPLQPMSNKDVSDDENTVTLNVTAKDATGADVASTNGVATVTYDPATMTLTGVTVNGDYTSEVVADGSVTFGYVKLDGFAAGDTVATLTFEIVDSIKDSAVVSFKEVNNESGSNEDVPASCPSAHLVDVDKDAWYHESVDYMVENGLMVGVDATHFNPDGKTTRAQLISVLYRMAGSPDVSDVKTTFKDVQPGKYYADAVAWGVANGIVSGRSKTVFDPDAPVSRQEMVTFLYRYASYEGNDVTGEYDLSVFVDANKVSSYAKDAMEWAVANGIIYGTGNNKLEPTASATRAQVAAILMRYCED